MLGVTPAMLRAWETAGLIDPPRSPAGFRLYQLADIVRLQRIRELVRGRGIKSPALARSRPGATSGARRAQSVCLPRRPPALTAQRARVVYPQARLDDGAEPFVDLLDRALPHPSVRGLASEARERARHQPRESHGRRPRAPASVVVKKQHRRSQDGQPRRHDRAARGSGDAAGITALPHRAGRQKRQLLHSRWRTVLYVLEGVFEITLDELPTYTLRGRT